MHDIVSVTALSISISIHRKVSRFRYRCPVPVLSISYYPVIEVEYCPASTIEYSNAAASWCPSGVASSQACFAEDVPDRLARLSGASNQRDWTTNGRHATPALCVRWEGGHRGSDSMPGRRCRCERGGTSGQYRSKRPCASPSGSKVVSGRCPRSLRRHKVVEC